MIGMELLLILLLGAFIAEIAWTIAGFGSSSIFLPIASQLLSFHNALMLVAVYHIFGNISRFSMFRKHWNQRIFRLFGIPSVVATVIGASLAGMIDPNILKVILGVVLFCFASYSLWRPILWIGNNPRWGRIGGALSWFSAGLIGTGGVLRGAFMSLFNLPKEQYIATIASVALLVDFTRIPLYFSQWFLDPAHIRYIPFLFIIAFLGSLTGKLIVNKISSSTFTTIIYVAIMLMSVWLVVQGGKSSIY